MFRTEQNKLYNMCHVMLYNICSKQNRTSYNIYICHVMLCNICHVMLYNVCRVMLYDVCSEQNMLYNICPEQNKLYNICHVM